MATNGKVLKFTVDEAQFKNRPVTAINTRKKKSELIDESELIFDENQQPPKNFRLQPSLTPIIVKKQENYLEFLKKLLCESKNENIWESSRLKKVTSNKKIEQTSCCNSARTINRSKASSNCDNYLIVNNIEYLNELCSNIKYPRIPIGIYTNIKNKQQIQLSSKLCEQKSKKFNPRISSDIASHVMRVQSARGDSKSADNECMKIKVPFTNSTFKPVYLKETRQFMPFGTILKNQNLTLGYKKLSNFMYEKYLIYRLHDQFATKTKNSKKKTV